MDDFFEMYPGSEKPLSLLVLFLSTLLSGKIYYEKRWRKSGGDVQTSSRKRERRNESFGFKGRTSRILSQLTDPLGS
jgi:hypothetical protein